MNIQQTASRIEIPSQTIRMRKTESAKCIEKQNGIYEYAYRRRQRIFVLFGESEIMAEKLRLLVVSYFSRPLVGRKNNPILRPSSTGEHTRHLSFFRLTGILSFLPTVYVSPFTYKLSSIPSPFAMSSRSFFHN